ncbi:hypothetical protein D9M71_409780 [compost metagenome]
MNESTELAMARVRSECKADVLHSPGAAVLNIIQAEFSEHLKLIEGAQDRLSALEAKLERLSALEVKL